MRRECLSAVSSALLFVSIVLASHHAISSFADASPGTQLLLAEFYPCALSSDEYFVISNAGTSQSNLANWSVSDGEGTLTFVRDVWLQPACSLAVSMNSTSYTNAYGSPPGATIGDSSGLLSQAGTFRLADAGDSLALMSADGVQFDFVRYGSSTESSMMWSGGSVPQLRQGEVAKRVHSSLGWKDSNSAGDWEPFREFRYGYTDLEPFKTRVPAGDLTAFTSPDCSLEVVLDALRSSQRSIRLCTYELSSAAVCRELMDAFDRGILVRILIDGAPTGGMSPRQLDCLSAMATAGLDVSTVNGNLSKKVVQHFGPLHSKYAVIDCSKCLVLSENFVESGVPEDRVTSNRGWGVCITSPGAGLYLTSMFDSDARTSRPDVISWRSDPRYSRSAVLPEAPISNHTYGSLAPMRTTSDASVELIPSPDASGLSPFLLPFLREAKSMLVEQFQVGLYWEPRWSTGPELSPLLSGMVDALRGGSEVRMLFDSSWFNVEGNGPAQRFMTGLCTNSSLRGEFILMDPRSPISVVHNKGAVFEGRTSLVSSNNWGYSSFAKNRELAAVIDSDEVGAYFTKAFEMDWSPDVIAPNAEAGDNMTIVLGKSVDLNGLGSKDDRGIAHFKWDMDRDGEHESEDACAKFIPDREGKFEIRLTVEDAWGNKDTDVVLITVIQQGSSAAQGRHVPGLQYIIGLLAIGLGTVIGRRLAIRRWHRSGKVNQRRDY